MKAVADVRVGADAGKAADQPLDSPQEHAGLVFGRSPGVVERAADGRRGEREEDVRNERRLEHLGRRAERHPLLGADPFDEGVDVAQRAEVGGDDPQFGVAAGVAPIKFSGPVEAPGVQARGRDDDGRTARQEPACDGRRDRPGRGAGDDGDLSAELARVGAFCGRGDREEALGALGAALGVPSGLLRHFLAGRLEVAFDLLPRGDPRDVLAGARPAVAQADGAVGGERGGDELLPAVPELGGHRGPQREVVGIVAARLLCGRLLAQTGEELAGGRRQGVGHLPRDLFEGGRIDHRPRSAAGAGL